MNMTNVLSTLICGLIGLYLPCMIFPKKYLPPGHPRSKFPTKFEIIIGLSGLAVGLIISLASR